MRNLLALVGAIVVLVIGLGWYLGWYKVGSEAGKVEIDVDTKKISNDLKKGGQAVDNYLHQDQKKVEGQTTSQQKDSEGRWNIVPTVPKSLSDLPAPPTGIPVQLNPDGSLKDSVTLPRPPDFSKGNK